MAKAKKLNPGDRIAYTRTFLRSICAGKAIADRRGVFVSYDAKSFSDLYARVKWDDVSENELAGLAATYGTDYAADIRENGSRVHVSNICKVGSVAFAD